MVFYALTEGAWPNVMMHIVFMAQIYGKNESIQSFKIEKERLVLVT